MADNEDLIVPAGFQGVSERPKSLDPNDLSGTEGIGVNDVRLPRLAIAQGLSPQMLPDDSQYIPDLKLFQMFNDLTGDIYATGPLTFIPTRRDVRNIEFDAENRGIPLDLDVPPGDPRLKWTTEDGERKPPKATTFVEFVILMLRPGKPPEPIVLSIKTTNKFNRRAADQLTTFIKLRNAPIYAGLYTVATKSEKNESGTFGVYIVKNAGFIPKDTPAGAALYNYAEKFSKSLEGKQIVVDREPGADDFDTATMDAQGKTTEM